jgi:hypothetical protein
MAETIMIKRQEEEIRSIGFPKIAEGDGIRGLLRDSYN